MARDRFFGLLTLLLAASCAPLPRPAAPSSPSGEGCREGLCITMKLAGERYGEGDPVNITLSLANTGDAPLVISPSRRIDIELVGKGGVYTPSPVPRRPPWPATARLLRPGERFSRQLTNLCTGEGCWEAAPGRYKIRVLYRMTEDDAVSTAEGIDSARDHLWTGTVETPYQKLRITKDR